jgi:MtaA/CmuA family methyltransferase
MNSRERVIALLEGRLADRLPLMPITMMFASDLIGAKYLDYATNFRVQAEAQLQAAERFGLDQVSVVSDPCCEASDLGASVKFFPDQPPAIDEEKALLAKKGALSALKVPGLPGGRRMENRVQAVSLLKERVGAEKVVEGWIEGPCAEAADLRGINALMTDFFDDPPFVRDLFEFVLELEVAFAQAQLAAGAEVIGVGDAAASLVGPKLYREFVWPYEKKMVERLHALGARVRLHICGNTTQILEGMGRLGCDLIDLDWPAPMEQARAAMGPDQVLLGNLDPVRDLRNGTPESVYAGVAECHRQAGPRFIVGAGCEVVRDTPAANLQAMARYAFDSEPARQEAHALSKDAQR